MNRTHHVSVPPFRIRRLALPAWLAIFAIVNILAAGCGDRSNTFSPEVEQITPESVTSARCGLCHGPYLPATYAGTYYHDWIQTAHGESGNTIPSDQTILADIDDDGVNDFKSGIDLGTLPDWTQYTLNGGAGGDFAPLLGFNGGSGKYIMTIGSRVFKVSKVIGIGRRKQAYLTRMGASSYILPALYDVKIRTWYPLIPENWYTWVDMNSNGYIDEGETIVGLLYPTTFDTPVLAGRTADAWERNCIGCHESGFRSLTQNDEGEFVAEFSEDGVGCESCHGPGGEHSSTLGGKDLPDRAIVNPLNLTASQQRDLCMSCHSRGTSVGTVGGMKLEFPWNPDDTPFMPGQELSKALHWPSRIESPSTRCRGTRLTWGSSAPGPRTARTATPRITPPISSLSA